MVIPLESEAQILRAIPVSGDLVDIAEGSKEVLSMAPTDGFDAKVIDNKREEDGSGFVAPEAGSVACRCISIGGKVGDETLVGQLASLGETIHAFADFDEDEAIFDEAVEVVLFHHAFRDGPCGDAHVFVVCHWGVQVKVGDVKTVVGGALGGECAVDDHFGCGHISGRSADIAGVIDEVAPNGEAYAVGFSFLGAHVHDNAEVGGLLAGWEVFMAHEVNGVGASDIGAVTALG